MTESALSLKYFWKDFNTEHKNSLGFEYFEVWVRILKSKPLNYFTIFQLVKAFSLLSNLFIKNESNMNVRNLTKVNNEV